MAKVARWPWTAYILTAKGCGGSLINRFWVLTAAHCFKSTSPNLISVVLGMLNTTEDGNIHEQTIPVRQIIIHPNYNSYQNDIALVRLRRPASLGTYVSTVCLPNGEEPQINETCYATGYGITSFRGKKSAGLREVGVPIVNGTVCENAYKKNVNQVNEEIHICAGYAAGGKDTCQGDSGGPLVCQRCKNCDWYLAGITSFGKKCGLAGFYGVYTRVKEYERWITKITRQRFSQSTCVKPSWHAWGGWSACSAECDAGTKSRIRFCINGEKGEPGCIGDEIETIKCNTHTCRVASWSSWANSTCSVTCGTGVRNKTRLCINGNIGDTGCPKGEEREEVECNNSACPVWEEWSSWSRCSASCGGGTRKSTRICNNFGVTGASCSGKSSKTENCSGTICPRWGGYGSWSNCDRSCGKGFQVRTRFCNNGNIGDIGCDDGARLLTRACNTDPCPYWSNFTNWGNCTEICGGGTQVSLRVCLNGNPGVEGCKGSTTRTRPCNEESCEPDWSAWSSCSVSCGKGQKIRKRNQETETMNCNTQNCPTWSKWSDWSDCSSSCGNGTRNALRTCNKYGNLRAGCTGSNFKSEICNKRSCSYYGSWGKWGKCTETCGGGFQARTRSCVNGKVGDDGCARGEESMFRKCNNGTCPTWRSWSTWSDCSVSCGGGEKVASRTCNSFEFSGATCIGSNFKTEPCNDIKCPSWGPFGNWGECSKTCGGGRQTKTRQCLNGKIGDIGCDNGTSFITRNCQENPCPKWGRFGVWNRCSKSCGSGFRRSTRKCINGDVGQDGCTGLAYLEEICNTDPCPTWSDYSEWGKCNVSCGGGTQSSSRICLFGKVGDIGCKGEQTKTRECATNNCPAKWGAYAAYGPCNATCGGGVQARVRECIGGPPGSGNCTGNQTQIKSCNTQACQYTPCAGVQDKLVTPGLCRSYVKLGWCATYFQYMTANCGKSCCLLQNGLYCIDRYPEFCPYYRINCIDPNVVAFCPETCGRCQN